MSSSRASLPTYSRCMSFDPTPSYYSTEPVVSTERGLSSGTFIKESKGRGVILRLNTQEDNVELPVYGLGSHVEGAVELARTDAVESVEVKIEGRLLLKEIAGSGSVSANICLKSTLLWSKQCSDTQCPHWLPFSLALPDTFTYNYMIYPLPPTFNVKLSGLPGFNATIEYCVATIVTKPSMSAATLKSLGINLGTTIVSVAFVYYPRSRPTAPLPASLEYLYLHAGFKPTGEWELHASTLQSRFAFRPNVVTKLYLPALRTFSITQPIPFYLTLQSTSVSLAAFLPFSPTVSARKRLTRIQLIRQSSVNVRQDTTNGDMWRTDCIGEGRFSHVGDGHAWISFSGEIDIDKGVKVTGFKAAGLSVKDVIVFSITPSDVSKSAFNEMRQVIPVCLTTDHGRW